MSKDLLSSRAHRDLRSLPCGRRAGRPAARLCRLLDRQREKVQRRVQNKEGIAFTSFSKHARSMRIRSRMAALAPL